MYAKIYKLYGNYEHEQKFVQGCLPCFLSDPLEHRGNVEDRVRQTGGAPEQAREPAGLVAKGMEEGIDQLMRYSNRRNPQHDEGAEKLFHFNQLMVSTHGDKARVGTITSRMEHFLEWKDPYPLKVEEVGEKSEEKIEEKIEETYEVSDKERQNLIKNFDNFIRRNKKIQLQITNFKEYFQYESGSIATATHHPI